MSEFATIPALMVITYLVIEVIKAVDKQGKITLPPVAGVTGLALGVAGFYITPELIPAQDIFSAMAIGIASGFAATGVNQVYKSLTSKTQ